MNKAVDENRSWWEIALDFFGFGNDEDEEVVAQAVEEEAAAHESNDESTGLAPLPETLALAAEELEETRSNKADHASDVADKVTLTEGREYTVTAAEWPRPTLGSLLHETTACSRANLFHSTSTSSRSVKRCRPGCSARQGRHS